MSRQESRLALQIIREEFGPIVATVATPLLVAPRSLRQLCDIVTASPSRDEPLHPSDVQASLLVLMQHGIAAASKPSPRILYNADVHMVLMRHRFPRIAMFTNVRYGPLAERIVEQLHLHGRMRLSQLTDILGQDEATTPRSVAHKMFALVDDGLVCRAFDKFAEPNQLYSVPAACRDLLAGESAGDKRKRADDETGSSATADADAGIYWRLNFIHYHRMFRAEWIAKFAETKVDASAGKIIQALLERHQRDALCSFELNLSQTIAFHDVKQIVEQAGVADAVVAKLESVLVLELDGIVEAAEGQCVRINVDQAIEVAHEELLLDAVKQRFGERCVRVFRPLLKFNHLEQDQLCSMALVANFKSTRLLLNELFHARFITVQEVAKQADRVPSRCHYLWSVDKQRLVKMLIDDTTRSLSNMRARATKERERNARILGKSAILKAPVDPAEDEDPQTVAERAELEKLERALGAIEAAEMNFDTQLLMLRDFDENAFRPMSA